MPSTPYPDSAARNEYDALVIDGTLFNLGKVTFDGDAIKRKVKVRGTPGANGASVRDRGSDVVDFKMTIELSEPGHWQAADALLALLNPQTVAPGRATRAALKARAKVISARGDSPAAKWRKVFKALEK